MEFVKINADQNGILLSLLSDAYAGSPLYCGLYMVKWREFDDFIFSNYHATSNHLFLSVEKDEIIGFFSWDPHGLPSYIRIGHNCIVGKYKGRGMGKQQLLHGIEEMKSLKPEKIVVNTGNIPFFIPARRMYESFGFSKTNIIKTNDEIVPETITYELYCRVGRET
ncbi:MAG: GNAT family N-acetyltransferase [Spirochaetales bacterium]|nr:GNAT family N-acetyltransferase [Spirochaetales bacterium]